MDELEEDVYALVAEFTGKKETELQSELILKSIANYELLIAKLEDEFDINISEEGFEEIVTLDQLIEKVRSLIEAQDSEAEDTEDFSDN